MHTEVQVALNFVISYLYNKLPRRRVDMLAIELEKGLQRKFDGHWYPDKPLKGTAYRCTRMSGDKMDPAIVRSIVDAGLDISEVNTYLPDDLSIWVDPKEVSYRIGEKGVIKILYSEKLHQQIMPVPLSSPMDESLELLDREIQSASNDSSPTGSVNRGFNPEAQCFRPIDAMSASLGQLSLSPSSPNPNHGWNSPTGSFSPAAPSAAPIPQNAAAFLSKSNSTPNFTAATFAQTKFGSTKLKSHAKRPSRLSPTEVSNYVKHRNVNNVNMSMPIMPIVNRPRSLSPRTPRPDFFDLQQQQQHPNHPPHPHHQMMFPNQPGMMPEMYRDYSPINQQVGFGYQDIYQQQNNAGPMMNGVSSLPATPEAPKNFVDGLNFQNLPYPNQIQHLLVAN